ncbi:MAG: hypothetical protein AAFR04_05810, partial [Pseudomonadota bacterium]
RPAPKPKTKTPTVKQAERERPRAQALKIEAPFLVHQPPRGTPARTSGLAPSTPGPNTNARGSSGGQAHPGAHPGQAQPSSPQPDKGGAKAGALGTRGGATGPRRIGRAQAVRSTQHTMPSANSLAVPMLQMGAKIWTNMARANLEMFDQLRQLTPFGQILRHQVKMFETLLNTMKAHQPRPWHDPPDDSAER